MTAAAVAAVAPIQVVFLSEYVVTVLKVKVFTLDQTRGLFEGTSTVLFAST